MILKAGKYSDNFGNYIETYSTVEIQICGSDNRVVIGENVKISKIVVGSSNKIEIENNCILQAKQLKLANNSVLKIEDHVFIDGMEIFINEFSILTIGSKTNMQTGKIRTGRNQKICIGRDCMFSWDVVLLGHDGHLLWDTTNGKSFDGSKNIECVKKLNNVELKGFVNTDNGVQISWEGVEGAKLYKVYRKQLGTNWIVLSSNEVDTSYTDVTAKDGKTYYYTVRAINGSVMSPSFDSTKNIECIKTLENVKLQSFANTNNGVQISWENVEGAKLYKVYRKQSGTNWIVLSSNEVDTSYTDVTAKDGETYYYTVRAVNGKVMSPSYDSSKYIVCIKKLKNVSSIKLKNISSGVQISWEKVDGTKQYKVYRKQPETGWIVLSNNVVETNYVDTTVKNGETYYYTVRAVNDKVMSPSYDSDKVIVY